MSRLSQSVSIPKGLAILSTEKVTHSIDVTGLLGRRDVCSLQITSKPSEEIVALRLAFGGSSLVHFDRSCLDDAYDKKSNLLDEIAIERSFVLEASRISFMTLCVNWEFDKAIIRERETETIEYEDELTETIHGYSDEESLYEDSETKEVRRGRRAYYHYQKTGQRVPTTKNMVHLSTPSLLLGVCDPQYPASERFDRVLADFWQPVDVDVALITDSYLERLELEGKVRRDRRLYLKQQLIYKNGSAGLRNSW